MARRIIHLEPTEAQWGIIDSLFNPFVPTNAVIDHNNPGNLFVYEVIDDREVNLYNVAPDGDYTYEQLNALNHGWQMFDSDDDPIDVESEG